MTSAFFFTSERVFNVTANSDKDANSQEKNAATISTTAPLPRLAKKSLRKMREKGMKKERKNKPYDI